MSALASTSCGSSSKAVNNSGLAAHTTSAFCVDDVKLDKAFANVQNTSDELAAIKANQPTINDLAAHLPPGRVGTEAKQVLDGVRQAISTNDATALTNLPRSYGGDIDTYCGVDTNGNPLPTDFAKGKGTASCDAEATLSNGIGSASDPTAALAFLRSHQTEINTFAAGVSGLPSALQPAAQDLISTARTAISSNDPTGLTNQTFQEAASAMDLYCGLNS